MIFLNPIELDKNVTLQAGHVTAAIQAIGTDTYSAACLEVFAGALDADHWTFFHHTQGNVACVAAASRSSVPSGSASIQRFVSHCHRFDPALSTASKQIREPMLVNKMDIGDIPDPRYRACFELTGVKERLSFYSRYASNLYQLSIYRGGDRPTLPAAELKNFTALASLIMITGLKHEALSRQVALLTPSSSVVSIVAALEKLPELLSKRECEVCARAIVGTTIERTAEELDIKPSSVITYRQRAYQKLSIRNQNELIARLNRFRA
jgi:DNA-binding CsgD family transcriptional regulator